MNYAFPLITSLDQVRKAIAGDESFVITDKGYYTVVDYVVSGPTTFPPVYTAYIDIETFDKFPVKHEYNHDAAIRRECRGLIFDSKTGEVLRRPYHKFFNVGEREETQLNNIDFTKPHRVLEKLDGSMIVPFIAGNKLIWGTMMGDTDVAKPVYEFIWNSGIPYEEFALWCNRWNLSPIFEWCSRKQRIVLDYPEDSLVLTAIRNMSTGEYYEHSAMAFAAESRGIPCVREFDVIKDPKEFMEYVRTLEDAEGFVVRFDDGHMVKVKSEWYCQIHKAKEAITNERLVVKMILDNNTDDVKSFLPPDDLERLVNFENDFIDALDALAFRWAHHVGRLKDQCNRDRKAFASVLPYNSFNETFTTIAFSVFDSPNVPNTRKAIIRLLEKYLHKNVRYEEIKKNLWPHLRY